MRSTLDKVGLRKLAFDPRLSELVMPFARQMKSIAVATAPVGTRGKGKHKGGYYKQMMFIRKVAGTNKVWVGSDDFKAWWVEFGSINNRAHHTLRNAAKAVGLHIQEEPPL